MPVVQHDVTDWVNLIEAEPGLAYRMLLVRIMMEQRGYTARSLAPLMDVSHERISQTLRPRFIRIEGSEYRPNSIGVTNAHVWLDRIEDALTTVGLPDGLVSIRAEAEYYERLELMNRADSGERRR